MSPLLSIECLCATVSGEVSTIWRRNPCCCQERQTRGTWSNQVSLHQWPVHHQQRTGITLSKQMAYWGLLPHLQTIFRIVCLSGSDDATSHPSCSHGLSSLRSNTTTDGRWSNINGTDAETPALTTLPLSARWRTKASNLYGTRAIFVDQNIPPILPRP